MASNKPQDPNLNAPDIDTSTGSAADVEAVMRKYDRESNTRVWEGTPKIIVGCILAAFSLFCIYVTLFANLLEQARMTSFMGLVIIMGYLTYPARKGEMKPNTLPWYDIVLMVLGGGAFLYYAFNAQAILTAGTRVLRTNPFYITLAVIGILSLAELCRRSVGVPILCVAIFFIAYTFLKGKNLSQVSYEMFYGENAILGTPVNVCSKYIVVFIVFGAFLEKTGVSSFFINLANSLTGRFAGGPAKVAVISSALCGMVSGSSVGNTVTTGSVTIPMMKKTGYRSEFAGAVEAAASTGGQIMPPIMGAAAFLMADYLGVPYSNIIVRAIVPAVLYFLGIFIAVHLEAKKLGLKGIDRSMLPRFKSLLKDTYLLLPLIVLIVLVCSNTRTMQFSAAVAIVTAIAVGFINNLTGYYRRAAEANQSGAAGEIPKSFNLKTIFDALEAGGRSVHHRGRGLRHRGLHLRLHHGDRPGQPPDQRHRGRFRQQHAAGPVPDDDLLHRAGHGRAHHGHLLHHGLHLRADTDPDGRAPDRRPLLRVLLRHRGRHHAAGGPGRLRRRGHRQGQADEDRRHRHAAGHRRVHHPLRVRRVPGAAVHRHRVVRGGADHHHRHAGHDGRGRGPVRLPADEHEHRRAPADHRRRPGADRPRHADRLHRPGPDRPGRGDAGHPQAGKAAA